MATDLHLQARGSLEKLLRDHRATHGVWPKYAWYTISNETRDGNLHLTAKCSVGDELEGANEESMVWLSGDLNKLEEAGELEKLIDRPFVEWLIA